MAGFVPQLQTWPFRTVINTFALRHAQTNYFRRNKYKLPHSKYTESLNFITQSQVLSENPPECPAPLQLCLYKIKKVVTTASAQIQA